MWSRRSASLRAAAPGGGLPFPPAVEGPRPAEFPGPLQADDEAVEVALVVQVVRVDERRRAGVRVGQAERAAAERGHQRHAYRVPALRSRPQARIQGAVEKDHL
jgi:hypothetical protein